VEELCFRPYQAYYVAGMTLFFLRSGWTEHFTGYEWAGDVFGLGWDVMRSAFYYA
jgi:hypothetical protein